MKTIKVLNKVFKEIDQSNTCEVIFTYKILKPEVHYIHTRVTMRNIKIGNKLSTMCSIVRLVENPLENPLYLIKDHNKGNGDQNLIKSKKEKEKEKKKKKKKKKSKHRNNKSVIVIAKKKIENEKENKKEKEKEIRKKKGKENENKNENENENKNEKEKESEMFTKREKEREKEKNNKFLFSDVSYSNLDVYSESLSTEFGASTVEEF